MTDGSEHSEQDAQPQPRQSQRWEPPRRTIGTTALGASAAGVAMFFWLLGQHGGITGGVTAGHIAAGILILGGLEGGRWAFGSQLIANAASDHQADMDDVVERHREDLAEITVIIVRAVSRLADAVTSVIDVELAQSESSRIAREQLGKMVDDVAAVQQRLDAMAADRWSDRRHARRGGPRLDNLRRLPDPAVVGALTRLARRIVDQPRRPRRRR